MTKYAVNLYTVAETTVEVDADSPEGAIEAAYAGLPCFCHSCPQGSEWLTASEMWPDTHQPDDDAVEIE